MQKLVRLFLALTVLVPASSFAGPAQREKVHASTSPSPAPSDGPAVTATATVRDPANAAPLAKVKGAGDDRSACFPPIGTKAPSNPAPDQAAQGRAQSAACPMPDGANVPVPQTR